MPDSVGALPTGDPRLPRADDLRQRLGREIDAVVKRHTFEDGISTRAAVEVLLDCSFRRMSCLYADGIVREGFLQLGVDIDALRENFPARES